MALCIGILAHPLRPQTGPIAQAIAATLRERSIETWVYTDWEESDVRASAQCADLVIAIGGDGAMLRAARVCAPFNVPVLGVNMGHLGFLTEIRDPARWPHYLEAVLARQYWIEERMMIRVRVLRAGVPVAEGDALNDIVVTRAKITPTVRLDTFIDGDWATTYNGDGLIIATATGSTAYALAVGGPIMPPELRNILIVPVAPHLSMDRPIILSEGATVEVRPASENSAEISLIVDGALLADLTDQDTVVVQASEHTSRFARLRERHYFYRSLLDRLEPRMPVNRERPRS